MMYVWGGLYLSLLCVHMLWVSRMGGLISLQYSILVY